MTDYRDYNLSRLQDCPVDIYIASNMPYPYPYKLMKPRHAERRVRDSCTTLIMDSGIADDTTNADVLELADSYDADFVVPCDELHNQPQTTEAVHEFLELYDDADVRSHPLIPLQPPYDEHYPKLSGFHAYALGGIAFDYSPSQQIEELHRFRRVAGPAPYAHAFGIGGSMKVVRALSQNPGLVQSVDCSTPEQAAINGQVIDANLKQQNVALKMGDGSSAGRYDLAQTNTYQLVDAYRKAKEQTETLAAFQ